MKESAAKNAQQQDRYEDNKRDENSEREPHWPTLHHTQQDGNWHDENPDNEDDKDRWTIARIFELAEISAAYRALISEFQNPLEQGALTANRTPRRQGARRQPQLPKAT